MRALCTGLLALLLFLAPAAVASEVASVALSGIELQARAPLAAPAALPQLRRLSFRSAAPDGQRRAQDVTFAYDLARRQFRTAQVIGPIGVGVMATGVFMIFAGTTFLSDAESATSLALGGVVLAGGGGITAVIGIIMGQFGWANQARYARRLAQPGPPRGLGFLSLGLLVGAVAVSWFGAGASVLGGTLLLASYIIAEVQHDTTHRYWVEHLARADAGRRALPVRVKLLPNGVVGRF